MGAIHVRNIKDSVKENLRTMAAEHGNSVEEEVRQILERAGDQRKPEEHLYHRMRRLVAKYGAMEIELPSREPEREPPDFSRWPED